jgi:nucleotide-binding universal stress UspA family protein
MQIVLVGDDGSDAAARAVEWARSFAHERALKVIAVYVTAAKHDARPDDGIERITLRDRHAAPAIMEVAADLDADLVVLGRRGAGGFPSLPIGTTAHHIAGSCGRPVAVIPPIPRRFAQPLVRRVTIGLDRFGGSGAALAWAARPFRDAHFTAVHALDLAPVFAELEADQTELYERAYKWAVALMHDQWCDPLVEARIAYEAVVEDGGPAEILLAVAKDTASDVVVVGQRDHVSLSGTLGGVSQRVLAYASCAALIVPSRPTSAQVAKRSRMWAASEAAVAHDARAFTNATDRDSSSSSI